jgi:CRP/FNR family transcriptional regulator, cyclic AMP receptor protein
MLERYLPLLYTFVMLASPADRQLLIDFFHTGQHLTYAKNEYIIGPDEAPRGVFFIESGLVKSYDITKYGEENLLVIRKEGEVMGLTWVITGKSKNIISTALAPTSVWLVSRERFIDFITHHPEASAPIIDTLADMYRLHGERIMTLEYRTVRERLASFLLTMANRFGTKSSHGITINAPLKQQDIASSISATRETTSRSLALMQQQGIISMKQSIIVICDKAGLEHIVD